MEVDKEGDVVVPRREATEESRGPEASRQEAEDLVLSEVHLECARPAAAYSQQAVATTAFCSDDGREVVSIRHALATPLSSVGLQVWRGALLLADYILSLADDHPGAGGAAGAPGTAEQAQLQCKQHADGGAAVPPGPLHGITALELGAGSGLAGLVLAATARRVFLTDTGEAVLSNCQQNAERHLLRHPPQPLPLPQSPHPGSCAGACGSLPGHAGPASARVAVRQLDWLDPPDWLLPLSAAGAEAPTPAVGQGQGSDGSLQGGDAAAGHAGARPVGAACAAAGAATSSRPFSWQAGDLQDLRCLDLLLAADPVYEDTLTEGLMRSALLLMRYAERHSGRSPRLLVALERRVVFTLRDAAERAPAFDYWRTLFEDEPGEQQQQQQQQQGSSCGCEQGTPSSMARTATAGQPVSKADGVAAAPAAQRAAPPLVGRRLEVARIPQRLFPYERCPQLELWELRLRSAR